MGVVNNWAIKTCCDCKLGKIKGMAMFVVRFQSMIHSLDSDRHCQLIEGLIVSKCLNFAKFS